MAPSSNRQRLAASKPKPQDFGTQAEYEEALGYWMTHQGRILSLTVPSSDSLPPSALTATM